ncbi:hypothetical protein Fmac_001347 [Flemingia macrophylla]|uniref:Uncharacterized protein n=1 Tax=Flemingia macrophylla TaxID=520843 RepID=A0ABD1NGU8_9FABA
MAMKIFSFNAFDLQLNADSFKRILLEGQHVNENANLSRQKLCVGTSVKHGSLRRQHVKMGHTNEVIEGRVLPNLIVELSASFIALIPKMVRSRGGKSGKSTHEIPAQKKRKQIEGKNERHRRRADFWVATDGDSAGEASRPGEATTNTQPGEATQQFSGKPDYHMLAANLKAPPRTKVSTPLPVHRHSGTKAINRWNE